MDEVTDRFASLRDETGVLIALYDQNDHLRYANEAFRSAFHLVSGETPSWADLMRRNRGLGVGTVLTTPDFDSWVISAQSRRGKVPFRAFETDLVDGRWLWMTETVERNGWMLCVASDITHLRASERDLRQDRDLALRASQTDELTGISNRRYVMGKLQDMVADQPAQSDTVGCVCILDLDFFKGINDLYGHQAGDQVLVDFARRVHPMIRRHDCFGRIGGEEFMLLLPQTDLNEGYAIVERVFDAIRGARPLPNAPFFSYTCSAGLVSLLPGEGANALYARADAALYAAKSSGRDRVAIGGAR